MKKKDIGSEIEHDVHDVDDQASASGAFSTEADTTYGEQARVTPLAPLLQGRYVDLGRIACGAFGDVRRVRDTHLLRVLAMKIMRQEIVPSPRKYANFIAEIEVMAELQHPGIVPIHDYGMLEDNRVWFTMKEVRGRTFAALIDELHAGAPRDGLLFRRAIDVLARLCQTVAFAHGRGIIHRDIKPTNVMEGEHGEAFVMDWGLARRLGPPPSDEELGRLGSKATRGSTHLGDVQGTPAYMPPEQALGEISLQSPASDVYSLGATLYHLLAGAPPYRGPRAAVLQQVRRGAPMPLAEVARNWPPLVEGLFAICERAMHRDPAARYADAGSLALALFGWLAGHYHTQWLETDGAGRRDEAAFAEELSRCHERHRHAEFAVQHVIPR